MQYTGSCHCAAVVFQVEAPDEVTVYDCNCSICARTGLIHLIVPKSAFRLMQGEDALTTYRFNTGVARHYFCRFCGGKSFYVPRSNPDGIDVNVRCLEPQPRAITVELFDGQNWEAEAGKLHHLSDSGPSG